MNPRIRRLEADYQQVMDEYTHHPHINILETQGNPPEKYVIEYRVTGLVPYESGFARAHTHRAEIVLMLDYPRRPPFCRMITPVFHPNINPQKICIGDHWSAGQNLSQLIRRIGEMVAYQSYNVKSPLNAEAAAWAEQNPEALPIEKTDLSSHPSGGAASPYVQT